MPVSCLEYMYGNRGCNYLYWNSVLLELLPWTAELSEVRYYLQWLPKGSLLESTTGFRFNIVLCNRYRTGRDSVGWHADSEPSMGVMPAIASLSLGATRKFQLRPRNGGKSVDFWLEHGSLLLMQPRCQEEWVHQIPKTSKPVGERVNLTFRPHMSGSKHE